MAWEDCEGNIRRQEVPGGWIYKVPVGTTRDAAVFVPEPSKVTGSNRDEVYDGIFKDGYDAAVRDYWDTPTEGDKASSDTLALHSDTAYKQGFEDGRVSAYDGDTPEGGPNKVTPEQADKASDEAYDEAYTDGWRAAGGKVTVEHTADGDNFSGPRSYISDLPKLLREQAGGRMTEQDKWFLRAIALLSNSLEAWEDEEDSVQEEHAEHIADLNAFFDDYLKMIAGIK